MEQIPTEETPYDITTPPSSGFPLEFLTIILVLALILLVWISKKIKNLFISLNSNKNLSKILNNISANLNDQRILTKSELAVLLKIHKRFFPDSNIIDEYYPFLYGNIDIKNIDIETLKKLIDEIKLKSSGSHKK
jgi:hypothetical protein